MKNILSISLFTLLIACVALSQGYSSDWSDLDEGEHKIFGSEKERKFPINAGVIEYERWEQHRSFHFFWFLKFTDYPRYTMHRVLPFYYYLESRFDRREKKFALLGLPYYRVRDFDYDYFTYFPLYSEKTTKNSEDWNLLYLFYRGKNHGDDFNESYFGLIPIFYLKQYEYVRYNKINTSLITPFFFRSNSLQTGKEQKYEEFNFSPLHFFYRKKSEYDRERIWGIPLIPLMFYASDEYKRHFNAGWLLFDLVWERKSGTIRLFPLAWYSWDEASDNKIINFLLYFYSKSGDQVYHVLFPLYGLSGNGDSYFNAYPLNGFWSEYDAETRRRELTFLWPFINTYWTQHPSNTDTEESGWLFFPFFWHKHKKEPGEYSRTRTISLLYYGYAQEFPESGISQRMTISPLGYFWNESRKEEKAQAQSKTFFFPIVPLYYASSESRNIASKGLRPTESTESYTQFLIPFWYYSSTADAMRRRKESTFVIPLLLFYNSSTSVSFTDDAGSHQSHDESTTFFPGFYRSIEDRKTHYNIIFIFDMGFDERQQSFYHMLIPLWHYSSEAHPEESGGIQRSFMLPLFPILCMYEGNSKNGYLFLPVPFLSYFGWEEDAHTMVIGGIFWKNDKRRGNEGFLHLLPFFMSWRSESFPRPEETETDRIILVPFIPIALLYDGTASNGYWFSPLLLSYHSWHHTARRTTIGGLFWKYNNHDSTDNYIHLLPFWMYWEDSNSREYEYFFPIAGLYVHNQPHYRHVNWMLLFDYERWEQTDTTELDFLFGIVSTRRTPDIREFEIALGLIARYENNFRNSDWLARVLWIGYEREGARRTCNMMPLLYYRSVEEAGFHEMYRFPLSFWHFEFFWCQSKLLAFHCALTLICLN